MGPKPLPSPGHPRPPTSTSTTSDDLKSSRLNRSGNSVQIGARRVALSLSPRQARSGYRGLLRAEREMSATRRSGATASRAHGQPRVRPDRPRPHRLHAVRRAVLKEELDRSSTVGEAVSAATNFLPGGGGVGADALPVIGSLIGLAPPSGSRSPSPPTTAPPRRASKAMSWTRSSPSCGRTTASVSRPAATTCRPTRRSPTRAWRGPRTPGGSAPSWSRCSTIPAGLLAAEPRLRTAPTDFKVGAGVDHNVGKTIPETPRPGQPYSRDLAPYVRLPKPGAARLPL
jgi:hypothetical protein